jgi:short-subunit dehydrogenase
VSTDFWEISGWSVAGGESFESAVPRPAWISPKQAAREGVDGLDAGRRVIVPGLQVRTAMRAAQYIPHAIKLPIMERVMRRK